MNKKLVGIIIFIILIIAIVGIKFFQDKSVEQPEEAYYVDVYIATGGGKEGFCKDERVLEIMRTKYGVNPIYDSWSNGRVCVDPLITKDGIQYDALFCSDQRFYDYYKLPADKEKGEADRYKVLDGGLTLNTPIVLYSWAETTDALINEGIVTVEDNVYYVTDMNKLLDYAFEGKKWSDIGVDMPYRSINIGSTDPVKSSPGATYYGLLISILAGGTVNEQSFESILPELKTFYDNSGYMNNAPADLFDRFVKTGMGGEPLIVDYEKSIVEFATKHPDGFDQIKDQIRILYPKPTIWNSHCIETFTDKGNLFYAAFEDPEIQQIAWDKYGFRTGTVVGNYDVNSVGIKGIPQTITSTVPGLRIDMYDRLMEYLGEN